MKRIVIFILALACILMGCGMLRTDKTATEAKSMSEYSDKSISGEKPIESQSDDIGLVSSDSSQNSGLSDEETKFSVSSFLSSHTVDDRFIETPDNLCQWFLAILLYAPEFSHDDIDTISSYGSNVGLAFSAYNNSILNRQEIEVTSYNLLRKGTEYWHTEHWYLVELNMFGKHDLLRQGKQEWVLKIEIPPYGSGLNQYEVTGFFPYNRYESMQTCLSDTENIDLIKNFIAFCYSGAFDNYDLIPNDALISFLMYTNAPSYIEGDNFCYTKDRINELGKSKLEIDNITNQESIYFDKELKCYIRRPIGGHNISDDFIYKENDDDLEYYFYYRYTDELSLIPSTVFRYSVKDGMVVAAMDVTNDVNISIYE